MKKWSSDPLLEMDASLLVKSMSVYIAFHCAMLVPFLGPSKSLITHNRHVQCKQDFVGEEARREPGWWLGNLSESIESTTGVSGVERTDPDSDPSISKAELILLKPTGASGGQETVVSPGGAGWGRTGRRCRCFNSCGVTMELLTVSKMGIFTNCY